MDVDLNCNPSDSVKNPNDKGNDMKSHNVSHLQYNEIIQNACNECDIGQMSIVMSGDNNVGIDEDLAISESDEENIFDEIDIRRKFFEQEENYINKSNGQLQQLTENSQSRIETEEYKNVHDDDDGWLRF